MPTQHHSTSGEAGGTVRALPWASLICWAIIIVGALLRINQWMLNRSLWLDESYLAVNILERGFGELHLPLEYSQSAPWLFLVATKAMVSLFGPGEQVLRFLPLVASILSLWVFWRLARVCLAGWTVPVALAIFTFSSVHFYYAQELKQYSLEVLMTTVVVWLAALMFRTANAPKRYFTGWAVAAGIGIYAMHAMPFVIAGIGGVALWASWQGKLGVSRLRIIVALALCVLFFAANYFVIISPNYADPLMRGYWAFAYPGMPWTMAGLRRSASLINGYFWFLGYGSVYKVLAVVLILGGVWRVIRRQNLVLLGCILTVVVYWLASMAGFAPFYNRLLMFMLPFFPLMVAQGLSFFGDRTHWIPRAVVIALVFVPVIRRLPAEFVPISSRDDLRDPIIQLAKLRQPAEPVYVMHYAVPAFRYYRSALGLSTLSAPPVVLAEQMRVFYPKAGQSRPPIATPNVNQMIAEMAEWRSRSRLWLLVSYMPAYEDDLLHGLQERLNLIPISRYKTVGTTLYLLSPDSEHLRKN
jgi:hypothetical protein